MFEIKLKKSDIPFAMAEEIKNLRTGITFSGENIKTVLFTSSLANEGKSTIAFETVRSFAELGKKTLFIDCDLRKSVLRHRITEGNVKRGLTHYLTGQCELKEIIYRSKADEKDSEFYVIPSGPISTSPSELLASDKCKAMIQKLREDYDIIIIDTPPLGSVVDASIISSYIDGVVLVIESGGVNYQLLQKIRDKILASNAKILGVVLNKVDKSKKSYGYYKYGKEYGYGYEYGYGE
ncbi:MAG: CpsD/CapB family tyrosine-protein kinase [Butyrivibrio sp.]|nr:CpsD/CapB family tyrosine-protein kinase [Butyrivibrio sp.]